MRHYKTKILLISFLISLFLLLIPQISFAADYSNNRIAGPGRYDTAVEISKKGWPNGAETIVLARGDMFPDALAGSPLAYKLNAPILLTTSNQLPTATKQEITRLKPKKVIILGGSKAILDAVKTEISNMGITVERISGSDRYQTSLEIAKRLGTTKDKAIVATGRDFPDALAIAPYAAKNSYPIILTAPDKMTANVSTYVKDFKSTLIVGGSKAISPEVENALPEPERISGKNRYETASKIIKENFETNNTIYISTGENFADALTGSVLAAKNNTAVMLVGKSSLPTDSDLLIAEKQVKNLFAFGGKAAVPDSIIQSLLDLVAKFKESVGTVSVEETVKLLDNASIQRLETAEDTMTALEDGTVTIKLAPDQAAAYKKTDILFIPPSDAYPTGYFGQVKNVATDGSIVIAQPAIDEVFKEFNIQADKVLTPDNLVDVNLEDGVALSADGEQLYSLLEWKKAMISQPSFQAGGKPVTVSIDKTLFNDDTSSLKVVGDIKLTSAEADMDLEKNWLGLIEGFDYHFESTQDSSIKFLMEVQGKIATKDQSKNVEFGDWVKIEGVDREGRVALASLTYQIGTAPVFGPGNRGYIQIPIGVTVFLTVNAKGEAKVEMEFGIVEKSRTNVDVEWIDDYFDADFDLETERYLLNFEGKGELTASVGVGFEPAINIGGLLPAVVQNDLSAGYEFKGNIKAEYDLKDNDSLVTGCYANGFKAGFESIFKARLKASSEKWDIEEKVEYEKTLWDHEFFNTGMEEVCMNSGKITGTVKDAISQDPLSNVSIKVYQDGDFFRTATTDANGNYEIQLSDGNYKFVYSKLLYADAVYNDVEIRENEVQYSPELRLIGTSFLGDGIVKGEISNSLNGAPVEGATLKVRSGVNSSQGDVVATAVTDGNGHYEITELPAGLYTAQISKDGFISTTIGIISIGGRTLQNQNGSITPVLDESETRIVLKWGELPYDLDSHLTGPYTDEERFHIFFGWKNHYENDILMAGLDVDDVTSYGPETTTIYQQKDGVYRFSVHDFSNSGSMVSNALSNSQAVVEVYRGSYLVRTFHVPTNKIGTVWTVFELRDNEIIPINTIANEGDNVFFSGQSQTAIDPDIIHSFKEKKN
ncbi:cell wall-binding repeat-containing protein [Bacillus sp. ISL-37]|uniref:cell wall-binding repeat-containing protein n=1 Tax=Bacillus sp. ISL-37 TaxID=2819123 RepID=UPI001BECCD7D|nr:cell wall-binding repeat-containing protein [Bacillus sp. ISL-37]MBT2686005.1 cell wall-binding repeat-containing protein [Bacillus sp. ISL-37]